MNIDNEVIIQFIKYALVGGLATMVHIILFHLIAWKVLPSLQERDHAVGLLKIKIKKIDDKVRARNSMLGNLIAFLIANMFAYVLNIMYVFEAGRYHWLVEIGLYYVASGFSTLLGTMFMGFIIRRFGVLTTYAFMSNIFFAVMINYVARKFVIFNG